VWQKNRPVFSFGNYSATGCGNNFISIKRQWSDGSKCAAFFLYRNFLMPLHYLLK
jgi:hypothetical protein